MIRIELPFPPSINSAYGNGGNKRGRHKMPVYLAWEKLAGTRIKDSHRIGFTSYTLHICLRRPDLKRSRDLGNYEKCLSDMLVAHGVVDDDSCCQRLLMTWDQGMSAECVVIIQQAEESLAA